MKGVRCNHWLHSHGFHWKHSPLVILPRFSDLLDIQAPPAPPPKKKRVSVSSNLDDEVLFPRIYSQVYISTGTGLPVYMLCSLVTSAPICLLYSASCLKLSTSTQSQWINLLWAKYFLFCMKIGCHQTACTVQLTSQTMIMTTIDNYCTNSYSPLHYLVL